ncbi:MAG: CHAD domain-containing protein [Candidatus Sulfotelmatobacter sp.]
MALASKRCQLVFRKLERNVEKLSAQQSAETVHSFRTSTRRLQILLEELIPERTRKQKKLLKLLRGLRKLAGKVRDLDVQLAALRSLKMTLEPRRKTQLLQGLIELRATHEKKLRKTLTKQAAHEICQRLKRTSKEVEPKTSRDPLKAAREILSRLEPPNGPVTEDALHRCRILVKGARYAAEFAPESPAAAEFITQLKRLQDILGNWHDWETLTRTAAERLGDVNQSSLVAVLHNVSGGKFRQAAAAVSASSALHGTSKPGPALASRKPGAKMAPQTARTESAA